MQSDPPKLRDYQLNIIENVRTEFRNGNRRVLVQSPTGSGKTALASAMLRTAAERGKRIWFLCHRRELLKQVSEAFLRVNLRHSFVAADSYFDKSAMTQICSIPTLVRRYPLLPDPDLIFIDESHHACSKSWSGILGKFPRAYMVGLSATPERLDGRGLADHFDAMVRGPSVAELIDAGYLSKYRLFAPATVDTSGLHRRMGDYVTGELNERINTPRITGDCISHYQRFARGTRAVVFCVSIEHSKAVARAFTAAGVPAVHIDGTTEHGLRDAMLADFKRGLIRVLTNVDLFGEGFDCPAIECSILLRPTMSTAMYLQQVGRALRPAEGKESAVILDHVGNSHMHGMPDDDRVWELTATAVRERKKSEVPSPRICPSCFGANKAGTQVCKLCGQPFPVEAREVQQVDGELAEMEAARVRREIRREQAKADSLEGLRELGRQRGHKPGWADHVWAARQRKRAS